MRDPSLMTVGEMAERIAHVDGVYSAPYLARQIRTLIQRGALTPATYQGEGRTAAAVFGIEGLCAARVLGALAQLGLSPDMLLGASRCLRNTAAEDVPAGKPHRPGLPLAIEGVKADEPWFFTLHVSKDTVAARAAEQDGADAYLADGILGGCVSRKPDQHPFEMLVKASIVLPLRSLLGALVKPAAES